MELSADVERIMKKYLNPSYSWDREPPQTVESPFKKVGAQLDQQIKDAKEESDRYLRQYLYTEENQLRNINNSIRTSHTQNLFDEAPLYTSSYISPEPSPSLHSYPVPSSYPPPTSYPPPSSFPPPSSYHAPSSLSPPLSSSYPPPPSSFPFAPSSYPPPPTYFSNVVEGRSDPDEFYRKMLYSTDFENYYKSDKPVRFETPQKMEDFDRKYGDLPKLRETENNKFLNGKESLEDEGEKKNNLNIFGDEGRGIPIKNDPYLQDDFAEIFEKPIISKTKLKETQEEKRNEIKFFPEVKSPLEALLEYTDKASEKKREEWNDFEHFEEFPNHEKFFRKPVEPIIPIIPVLPKKIQENQNQSMETILKGLILLVLVLIFLIIVNKIFF